MDAGATPGRVCTPTPRKNSFTPRPPKPWRDPGLGNQGQPGLRLWSGSPMIVLHIPRGLFSLQTSGCLVIRSILLYSYIPETGLFFLPSFDISVKTVPKSYFCTTARQCTCICVDVHETGPDVDLKPYLFCMTRFVLIIPEYGCLSFSQVFL